MTDPINRIMEVRTANENRIPAVTAEMRGPAKGEVSVPTHARVDDERVT